ncbi:MAG: Similar to citrate lyase beta chain, 2, partial [uncultured Thermomicrobiales bacterium]
DPAGPRGLGRARRQGDGPVERGPGARRAGLRSDAAGRPHQRGRLGAGLPGPDRPVRGNVGGDRPDRAAAGPRRRRHRLRRPSTRPARGRDREGPPDRPGGHRRGGVSAARCRRDRPRQRPDRGAGLRSRGPRRRARDADAVTGRPGRVGRALPRTPHPPHPRRAARCRPRRRAAGDRRTVRGDRRHGRFPAGLRGLPVDGVRRQVVHPPVPDRRLQRGLLAVGGGDRLGRPRGGGAGRGRRRRTRRRHHRRPDDRRGQRSPRPPDAGHGVGRRGPTM